MFYFSISILATTRIPLLFYFFISILVKYLWSIILITDFSGKYFDYSRYILYIRLKYYAWGESTLIIRDVRGKVRGANTLRCAFPLPASHPAPSLSCLKYPEDSTWLKMKGWGCVLDRFTKTFLRNFQNSRADLCYILIYKQMLEKAFCSNIAPSLSSGNHLFYKAEYMGRSCPNQVWTITFDWSALATWNKHF